MEVVRARNVNSAYAQGLALLRSQGVLETSRAGDVLAMPCPVTTVYERPCERVLFDPVRDANPFFHLMEALHMLAGRRDARWLDRFVRDFSSRFAEEDGNQHGAYGFRWRHHFDVEGGGRPSLPDQLETVVQLLRANSHDRRVVLTMWDPVADLGVSKRDIPCNTHAYLRVRTVQEVVNYPEDFSSLRPTTVLDLTVCCRSNDAIWGAYGANAAHFSVLQEYLAGRIGVGVGRMYQVSHNFHAYVGALEKVGVPSTAQPYETEGDHGVLRPTPMGKDWDHWDEDLARFMVWADLQSGAMEFVRLPDFANDWFGSTACTMYRAHWLWKQDPAWRGLDRENALSIGAPDWRLAACQWFERRLNR